MYGHNNVADGWAGAANTHPHSTPHPTPFPTQTPAQKGSKTLVFPLFNSGSRTDGQTNGRTDQQTNGQTDRQTDQWMDVWTKPLIELCVRN